MSGDDAKLSPQPPDRHGDRGPGYDGSDECDDGARWNGDGEDGGERGKTDASQAGSGGVERSSLLSPSPAIETGLFFRTALMTFDQRSAGAEDRRKREEKSTDGLAEMGPDKSRQNRCQAAKHETNAVLVPTRPLQRR